MGKIPGYQDGSYEDDSWDTVGQNPTKRPRRSSAKKRRQKDNKLFGGTIWGRKPKDEEK